ncbi:MAG: aspartate-semialdehyde dehydrogenase [Holosporales bacterium]|jgi:aspartate-semialdehyde dehydrogenase|nr:aspartate-semialdehyde dehydrogenase [Holosporales bacterium]
MSSLQEIKIAVVGATGLVGQGFLTILHKKYIPADNVFAVASEKSQGATVPYGETTLSVHALSTFDFSQCSVALFSPGASVSSVFAPKAAAQGCWVVDNTSFFRMDPDVPLVVPEVNAHAIASAKKNIVANPNCSTIQMVMALKPIDDVSRLRTVIVSTYQSVSGAGRSGVAELQRQISGDLSVARFPRQIAYNVIPQIDVFMDDGQTKEEWKMVVETQKILRPDIAIVPTCVRVPVWRGHSESVAFELSDDVSLDELNNAIGSFPGVVLVRSLSEYVSAPDVEGRDEVFVCRLRQCGGRWYQMWVVADNLRKGAATNAIQIAEIIATDM